MTPIDHIRSLALALPDTDVREEEGATVLLVAGVPFARLGADNTLVVGERAIMLDDVTDWTLVEDELARGWELKAPAALLEAGGR